jgi:UDP-N-acetylglucosamine diphosphorylase / glucose-1-phosphate thymidylyltransferase / UDP-N-acetylgalactosamine diphosphorylase / glucosamine-1-phosphate N-acetyltransferase / galactosamine-1-phosphate N-acetyltransferase
LSKIIYWRGNEDLPHKYLKLRLTFFDTTHYLHSILGDDKKDHTTTALLKLAGQTLVLRNITILNTLYDIDTIRIPDKFPKVTNLIEANYPSIGIEIFNNDDYAFSMNSNTSCNSSTGVRGDSLNSSNSDNIENTIAIGKGTEENNSIQLPLNSVLWCSEEKDTSLYASLIVYPWNFLNISQKLLYEELRQARVSPRASIAKSSIIEGPCVIEDDVIVDDYCKIIGPSYIGKGSFIGMNSLVRKCTIGEKTKIGFNCELATSCFIGNDKISHKNVILDSIIGENVWFGGYAATTNVLHDRKNIKYKIDDVLVDTGTDHFGSVVGNNCAVGASVIILPGTQILPTSIVQAGTAIGKDQQ